MWVVAIVKHPAVKKPNQTQRLRSPTKFLQLSPKDKT